MALRVGINGLGRIGRALLRIVRARPELGVEIAAVNDFASAESIARLLRHDTIHGAFPTSVVVDGESLAIGGTPIPISLADRPRAIDWSRHGVEIVVESTGRFRSRASAAEHLHGSVGRVVVSATIPDADATFCLGINEGTFDPKRHRVVSNASCTTNCLAVMLHVLHREFGVAHALMNTVHCVTNSQNLVDMAHADPRRARSALANIIPTTSDAIPSIEWVIPAMRGRVEGLAMRVPVVAGSLVDLAVEVRRRARLDEVADAFREAEAGYLAGILATTEEPLVSSDAIGDSHSALIDLGLLQRSGDRLFRIVAWYDNEWGYSNRLAELLAFLAAYEAKPSRVRRKAR